VQFTASHAELLGGFPVVFFQRAYGCSHADLRISARGAIRQRGGGVFHLSAKLEVLIGIVSKRMLSDALQQKLRNPQHGACGFRVGVEQFLQRDHGGSK
jgi:hypothetical protein